MSSLSPGDEDLHDDADETLHVWCPPFPVDSKAADDAWIARAWAHDRAHHARATAPVIDPALDEESTLEIWR